MAATATAPPVTRPAGQARTVTPSVVPSDGPFTALGLVRTPRFARRFAVLLLVLLLTLPLILCMMPWQQTLSGRGRLIALNPDEREQFVTSTLDGLVLRWGTTERKVTQQTEVRAGDVIVELVDTDENLAANLATQRSQAVKRLAEFEQRVAETAAALVAQERAVEAQKAAAVKSIDVLTKTEEAAKLTVAGLTADLKGRQAAFQAAEKGVRPGGGVGSVVPQVEFLGLQAAMLNASAGVARASVELARVGEQIGQARATVEQVTAAGLVSMTGLRGTLAANRAEVENTRNAIVELDVRLSRYTRRTIRAERDGWVQEVMPEASQAGQYVKTGQKLAVFVPKPTTRAVELILSGIDAPLILTYHHHRRRDGLAESDPDVWPHVRLQFQGYPALQFHGWPSAAFGTFGGRIVGMNPTDNGKGDFAVLVVEDRRRGEFDAWPPDTELLQGNEALGWVFLNRVTMGYELWRRLNGFPPMTADHAPLKGDANTDKFLETKPVKVKK